MATSSSCASSSSDRVGRRTLPVVVLHSRNVYSYTIPSFCVIQMDLQQVVLRYWEDDAMDTLDVFVRVGDGLPSTDRPNPSSLRFLQWLHSTSKWCTPTLITSDNGLYL